MGYGSPPARWGMPRAMGYPRMLEVRQRFDAPRVDDVAGTVAAELARIGVRGRVQPGATVAIGVGSRGITNLALVVRTLVGVLKEAGARPFVVPAMGSHGGATVEGQRAILAGYGITEDGIGAPIRASMETVDLGATDGGIPIHFDRTALEADHVAIVNRVKPHTNLARGRIAFGLALVENGYDETALVEAVPAAAFTERDQALLVLAKRWLPRLPVHRPDLLIVDEMGKNVSGSGMDTNVVGRKPHGRLEDDPQVKRLFVRELTPETRGNAYGIGLADFATSRLIRAIDYRTTAVNSLTAANPEAAAPPIHFDSDREVIDAALASAGLAPPERTRVVRIRNTLHLDRLLVSEACRAELAARGNVEIVEPAHELAFDEAGNLPPLRFAAQ